ncbi:MAG: flagellar hook-length control protein FliK [Sphingomonadaceae bacterium]|nr:flagellar hook-length control protein FliK [Sphingomonadaceae bacterium]
MTDPATTPELSRGRRPAPEVASLAAASASAHPLFQPTTAAAARAGEPHAQAPATASGAAASPSTAALDPAGPPGTDARSELRVTAGQLGPVTIRIERSGPALNVTLGAMRADAEAVLRDGLDTLERSLAASNAGPLALSVATQPGRDEHAAPRHALTLLAASAPSAGDPAATTPGPLPAPTPSLAATDPAQLDPQRGNPASTGPYPPATGSPGEQPGTPHRHPNHGHGADTPGTGAQPDGERHRHRDHATSQPAAQGHAGYRRSNPSATRQPARSALKGRVHVLA